MKIIEKAYVQHVIALIVFLIVGAIYFYPETQGKKILSHDHISHVAAAKEINDYNDKGETVLWASRIFSGMPAFQVAYSVKSNILTWVYKTNEIIPKSMWLFILLMIGIYSCLSILNFPFMIRIIGGLAFGLSTWFLLSIEAGHATKLVTISFIPPLFASILISYKGKWLIGGALTSLFLGLAIMSNHIQIVYYSIFFLAILFITKAIEFLKLKKANIFIKRTIILIGFGILGILPNITLLWTTYDYGNETIRGGKSELTKKIEKGSKNGLDIEYAMAWSYGPYESFNLLIPGLYAPGGSLDEESKTYQFFKKQGVPKNQIPNYLKGIPMYYGTQTTPSGPTYLGVGLIFLFIILFFISKQNIKWVLLFTIVLALFFSWGSNFLSFNELFFYNFPLFNKFRTPSMWLSLVIIAITIGAMITLKIIYKNEYQVNNLKKGVIFSTAIIGGISLLYYLLGASSLTFEGPYDNQLSQSGFPIDEIIADRINLLKSDAIRTFFLTIMLFGIIWATVLGKIKNIRYTILLIGLVLTFDVWIVGKRYLNEDDFTKAKSFEKSIIPTMADQNILEDNNYYRVFNTTVSSFNDNSTSYFHHSVGGYSAAKLILYQDLIENQLAKGNMNVYNMLNTKYFIAGKPGQEVAQPNPNALGNAWFINNIEWVDNADNEMEKLDDFNPKSTVIIDKRYKSYFSDFSLNNSNNGDIILKQYHPDNMVYESNSNKDNFAVFSEIWYKGNEDWKAYLDGKEVEHIRVNYLLRGMKIPAGKHEIVFKFHPNSHYIGSKISLASSILLILLLVGIFFMNIKNKEFPGMNFD